MKQDFLSQVLPPQTPAVTAAELPAGAQIREAEREAGAIHEALDMIRLSDGERGEIGPASTAEEMELSRLYAEATEKVPVLLEIAGQPAGAMQGGYDMERALLVYRQANQGLLTVARSALLLASAALTADNDRAEDAARALSADPRVAPARRAVIGNAQKSLDELRATQRGAQEERRARKARREAAQQAELLLVQKREAHTRRLAQLATAPLPEESR